VKHAMPDHDDSRQSIREIKIPCSGRTNRRNHGVAKRFENLLANRQQTVSIFDLDDRCHRFHWNRAIYQPFDRSGDDSRSPSFRSKNIAGHQLVIPD